MASTTPATTMTNATFNNLSFQTLNILGRSDRELTRNNYGLHDYTKAAKNNTFWVSFFRLLKSWLRIWYPVPASHNQCGALCYYLMGFFFGRRKIRHRLFQKKIKKYFINNWQKWPFWWQNKLSLVKTKPTKISAREN